MKRQFVGPVAIILVFLVFPYAYANLGVKQAPGPTSNDPTSPAYSIHLNTTPKTSDSPELVQIRYRNMPLSSVLQNISDETGVVFQVSKTLLNKEVNADVSSKSWESAISKLLTKYSRLEVWTDQTDSSRVWLFEKGEGKPEGKKRSKQKKETRRQEHVVGKNPPAPVPVPMAQTFGGSVENLPPHIIMEPTVIDYLEKAGVAIPESVRRMIPPLPKGIKLGKIPPYILNDPKFMGFLGANGIPRPIA